ncbi:MAG: DUF366 family protein [Candidatus Margulisiibacteriota bacterium]|jgi:hypothetical protein
MIKAKFINKRIDYTGEQLSSLWIYKNTGFLGDAITSFTGKAEVSDHMVDMEDVLKKEFIYSENMLHFIIEHFDQDLEKAVLRQRMLICIIKELLASGLWRKGHGKADKSTVLDRQGDDLYYNKRKLSVSIATLSPVSSLIHVGLNISSKNTPVPTIGLNELMPEADLPDFARSVMSLYVMEMRDINTARCKVKGVA